MILKKITFLKSTILKKVCTQKILRFTCLYKKHDFEETSFFKKHDFKEKTFFKKHDFE